MKILIMGGAGMIGQKLLNLLLKKENINNQKISEITLSVSYTHLTLPTSYPV